MATNLKSLKRSYDFQKLKKLRAIITSNAIPTELKFPAAHAAIECISVLLEIVIDVHSMKNKRRRKIK